MNRQILIDLCKANGLVTLRQAHWTQIGPRGAVRQRARDSRVFYVNHTRDIADLRARSGPPNLIARVTKRYGNIDNGQIVARIPLDLFSDGEWRRLIAHLA
jgi:hypothetical protein